jgi:hypothetical protein
MLAIKLHKKTKPYLGKDSYVVPLFNWKSGESLVRSWLRVLTRYNRGMPNDKVRFMTLVRIPDDLPISLHDDWINKTFEFLPWKEHPRENHEIPRKAANKKPDPSWFGRFSRTFPAGNGLVWMFDEVSQRVVRVPDPKKRRQLCVRWPGYSEPSEEEQTYTVLGKKFYFNGENLSMPEMVLGALLPDSNILWTKDIRLLLRGNQRSKKADRQTKRECRNEER